MDPQDFFRWGVLRNQSRQTQLLEELNWRMMSPAEKAAVLASREKDEKNAKALIKFIVRTLAFVGTLCVMFYLLSAWSRYRQNSPLTAKQVRSVIEMRQPFAPYDRGTRLGKISYDKNIAGTQFLVSSRPLAKDAIEMIASTDISFWPRYPLSPSDVEVLVKKKNGWLILEPTFGSLGPFKESHVNVWLDCLNHDENLEEWKSHSGELRVSLISVGEEYRHIQAKAIFRENGKRIEFVKLSY